MRPPRLVIQIEVERLEPFIGLDCENESQQHRLQDWIRSQACLQGLVDHALLLLEPARPGWDEP